MVILILERVPISLRGELTRWVIEAKTGVFVGKLSGMVRDRLWDKVCDSLKGGGAILIHSADNEQGFAIRVFGDTSRAIVDFDGLQLIKIKQ